MYKLTMLFTKISKLTLAITLYLHHHMIGQHMHFAWTKKSFFEENTMWGTPGVEERHYIRRMYLRNHELTNKKWEITILTSLKKRDFLWHFLIIFKLCMISSDIITIFFDNSYNCKSLFKLSGESIILDLLNQSLLKIMDIYHMMM
jgi:hypothetical protein